MMQPVMRVLDYVLVQILGPLGDRKDFQEDSIIVDTFSESLIKLSNYRNQKSQFNIPSPSEPQTNAVDPTVVKLDFEE